jgi:hypothetical protein
MADDAPADLFRRVYEGDAEGEAYHGPALRRLLAGLSPEEAAARPIPRAHSIVEIVHHLAAWLEWTDAALAGRACDLVDDGWAAVDALDAASWQAGLERLDAAYQALRQRLEGQGAGALSRFALHHLLHHGGQVALLRRATSRSTSP